MLMGIKEIKEILPHRHPFLLVDCIEELTPGVRAVGYKNLTYDEAFFCWSFPGRAGNAGRIDGRGTCADRCGCCAFTPGEQGKNSIFCSNQFMQI